ncbi:MAG: TRAP transporter small permease [Clostridiales bacterium]|nr:TRAP transporter small permease [Clostridiales bacterium]
MIKRIGDLIERIILVIIGFLVCLMICVTVCAVVQRYIIGSSFRWCEELSSYSLIWVTFLGAAVSYRHYDLVLLNLFTGMLPKKYRSTLELIVHIICMALIVYIAYSSLRYGLSPSLMKRKSTTLGFSMFVPFSSVPIGFFLMLLFSIENIPDLINAIKTGEPLKNLNEG